MPKNNFFETGRNVRVTGHADTVLAASLAGFPTTPSATDTCIGPHFLLSRLNA
jgi:hypothetical protein